MLDIVEKKRGITLQTVKGLSDAILCEKVQVEILSLIQKLSKKKSIFEEFDPETG